MKKNNFLKSMAVLLTGTAVAQFIPILISPILTRFYSQDDFGVFATYAAIVNVITILATAQYDVAIMMPKNRRVAFNLFVFVFINALVVSLLSLVVFLGLSFLIDDFVFNNQNKRIWFFVSVGVFFSATYQAINYWFNRNQYYKRLAVNRVGQTSVTAITSLVFAQFFKSLGLILGQLTGLVVSFVSILMYLTKRDGVLFKSVSKKRMMLAIKRYNQYPKVNIPISLVNSTYNNSKFLILAFVFSSGTIGQLYLVYRVIGLPASIVGNALSEVMLQRVATNNASKDSISSLKLIVKSILVMSVLSIFPCIFLFLFGECLFELVFGKNWGDAGKMAAVLSIGLAFEFIVAPLSKLMFVINKNKQYLAWEVFRAIIIFLPLFLAKTYYDVEYISYVWMISFSTAISYIVLLVLVLRSYRNAE